MWNKTLRVELLYLLCRANFRRLQISRNKQKGRISDNFVISSCTVGCQHDGLLVSVSTAVDPSVLYSCLSHIQPRAPYDFYPPYDFLPVRPSEAPVGILRRCCSRGHISLRAPYDLTRVYTCGLVEWFSGLHGYPVRGPNGHRTGPARKSSMLFISYGTRTGPVRDPQGCRTAVLRTRKGIDTTRIDKTPARASYLAPQGLFTGCLESLNPYGARKLIMHALKLYGPRTGRQNSYGAARGPCGPREWTYDFCSKQPGNSPYGARECDVTEALTYVFSRTKHVINGSGLCG